MKFALIDQAVLEKMFENGGQTDGTTTDHGYMYTI